MTIDEKARLWAAVMAEDTGSIEYKHVVTKPPFIREEWNGALYIFKGAREGGYELWINPDRLIGALTRKANKKLEPFLRLLEEYDIPKDGEPQFTPKEGKWARIVTCGYRDGKWRVLDDPADRPA